MELWRGMVPMSNIWHISGSQKEQKPLKIPQVTFYLAYVLMLRTEEDVDGWNLKIFFSFNPQTGRFKIFIVKIAQKFIIIIFEVKHLLDLFFIKFVAKDVGNVDGGIS